MKMSTSFIKVVAMLGIGSVLFAPATGYALEPQSKASKQRQQKKNEWRNLTIASGVAGIAGILSKNGTLTFLGTAGALYSAHRYEQDRKSQSKIDRDRAALYSRTSFTKDGQKFVRKTKWQKGKKYYYFVKAK